MNDSTVLQQDSLKHLSYLCPGLHDKSSRQKIERKSFRSFFQENNKLIIPLIQRRYCWSDVTVSNWFEDVINGKIDHLGQHNSGNVVIKYSELDNGTIILDGQQRITTTSLLLAALNDVLDNMLESFKEVHNLGIGQIKVATDLKQTIMSFLFREELSNNIIYDGFKDGEDFPITVLLPSFRDRKAYFHLITSNTPAEDIKASFQCNTKNILRSKLDDRLDNQFSIESKLEFLVEFTTRAIDVMSMTLVTILSPIDISQVFQWMQEKTLLSAGGLLKNPTPGVDFTVADLLRNLTLAPVMNQSLQKQEEFYWKQWLFYVESKFQNMTDFNKCLHDYIDARHKDINGYMSSCEQTVFKVIKDLKGNPKKFHDFIAYGKCISIYEYLKMNLGNKKIFPISRLFSMVGFTEAQDLSLNASVEMLKDFRNFATARKKILNDD